MPCARKSGGRGLRALRGRVTRFEVLEPRQLLTSTLFVNTLADTTNIFLGETFPAYNPGDPLSLRDAVAIANNTAALPGHSGDQFQINFNGGAAAGGTINLSHTASLILAKSDLVVASNIDIEGLPAASSANGITIANTVLQSRIFAVAAIGNLTLDSVTLTGGAVYGGDGGNGLGGGGGGGGLGGAVLNDGTLTLLNSTLSGNTATGGTGGPGGTSSPGGQGGGWNGGAGAVGAGVANPGGLGGGGGGGGTGTGYSAGHGGFGGGGGGAGFHAGTSQYGGYGGFGGGNGSNTSPSSTTGGFGGGGAGMGGALFNMGIAVITNCTFTGNTATGGLAGGTAPRRVMVWAAPFSTTVAT